MVPPSSSTTQRGSIPWTDPELVAAAAMSFGPVSSFAGANQVA